MVTVSAPFTVLTGPSRRRYYLAYHAPHQVLWGFGIGVVFGTTYYLLVEYIPTRRPHSLLGKFRTAVLANPLSTWFRLRDGWSVWADSGTEVQWLLWREEWDRQRLGAKKAEAKAQ